MENNPYAKLGKIYEDKESKIIAEERHQKTLESQQTVSDTILVATASLAEYLEGRTSKTEVINQIKGFATSEDVARIASVLSELDKTIQTTKPNEKLIVDAINALKQESTSAISKIKLEKTEKVSVTNLNEVKLDTKSLEKAIKDKKLEVNVEAPIINTEKVDLKIVEQILTNVLLEIKKKELKVPDKFKITNLKEIKPTDTKKIETKLDKGNKLLKEIADKPVGGGGGGGRATPYQDSSAIPAFVTIGQQVAGSSVPVVLPAAQITTLTPPSAITGFATETTLAKLVGLGIPEWDYVSCTPAANPTSVVFKTGGSGGTTVATLTIAYTGTDISSVTRT